MRDHSRAQVDRPSAMVRVVMMLISVTILAMVASETVNTVGDDMVMTMGRSMTMILETSMLPMAGALIVVTVVWVSATNAYTTASRTTRSKPNTLQDDIEEAQQRYMDGEIAEHRLAEEVGEAMERHDESEDAPSRLDEQLMDDETTKLLKKMENA